MGGDVVVNELPGFDPAPEPEPRVKLTSGQKSAERISRGIHPASKLPLLPGDNTCGDCGRLWEKWTPSGKHFYKCSAMNLHNDGPDMTKKWPACTLWVRGTEFGDVA
mgnify:CR=1 FL=1